VIRPRKFLREPFLVTFVHRRSHNLCLDFVGTAVCIFAEIFQHLSIGFQFSDGCLMSVTNKLSHSMFVTFANFFRYNAADDWSKDKHATRNIPHDTGSAVPTAVVVTQRFVREVRTNCVECVLRAIKEELRLLECKNLSGTDLIALKFHDAFIAQIAENFAFSSVDISANLQ
jgi:hypothetical protein